MKNTTSFAMTTIFVALIVSGCATPKPVLDLASQGAAIAEKSELELEDFVKRTERLHALRLASVRRLSQRDIEAATNIEFENYSLQRAGAKTGLDLVKLIRELSEKKAQIRENTRILQAEREKELANKDDAPKIPKKELADLRNAFAQLAEELTTQEWLMFAFAYAKQVNESQKKSKDNADKAESSAKSETAKLTTGK